MNDAIEQLLIFFHLCERLKTERRHGKTSDGENDRVASHSWRMAIMVVFLCPFLDKKIDLLKAIKIALIHDLPEIITGDIAYFNHMFDNVAKIKKAQEEEVAIKSLVFDLPPNNKNELIQLWNEYTSQNTYEAKIIKAIDKLEAQIQHNEADISVWNEYDRKYHNTFLDKFCDFDDLLKLLKKSVQKESTEKLATYV
jgi:putative hydrolases of HD superfamily